MKESIFDDTIIDSRRTQRAASNGTRRVTIGGVLIERMTSSYLNDMLELHDCNHRIELAETLPMVPIELLYN
jgi:hypothetical protein